MNQTFKPTATMILAAETLFKAIAFRDVIKPIVLGYEIKILAEGQWRISPHYAEMFAKRGGADDNQVVLSPDRVYLMSESDSSIYYEKCKQARITANLHVDREDACPLLVAELLVIEAEQCLIDSMFEQTKVTKDKLTFLGMNKYHKFIDLTLQLLAPFVRPKLL